MQPVEFGRELRRRRVERGMSLGALAKLVHYSKSHLSRIENGIKRPSEQLSGACDRELGACGALIASAQTAATEEAEPGRPVRSESPRPRAVSAEMLPGLREMFRCARAMGRTNSPSLVLPTVRGMIVTAENAAAHSTGKQRRDLLLHGARIAEFAGWMAQERGDDVDTLRWTEHAVTLASAAGDKQMGSYAFVRRAVVSLYHRDPAETVGLTERIYADHAVHPRIRWLAALGAAQGYAIGKDKKKATLALDHAATLYDAVRRCGEGEQLGPSALLHDRPIFIQAWCHYDLGDLDAAAELFERAMSSCPPSSDRDRARFGTRHALVHAARGEPRRACELIAPLLELITVLDSATIRADLRILSGALHRRSDDPAVRAILPALAGALSRS
ncbi:helix-turn-helix domain-containing protein [Nocardia bovistercoris]|uniref:Helix-turn-helix transcriptional regulator n=1 Tax=Nocardia bovistercoris TaxID=2785916 RepID=A0A931N4F0_9NOCA|nr:helix-turn-helix transcriptional regulator [Nocardia bovistercoris]MBH0778176.1 helix-turn-helix transcriptional regulator [Nocardia bovistercoris]